MEKGRKTKAVAIVALIVAVLGLTVAFAALSTTLTINGTAQVNTATWDIHFEDLSSAVTTGDASELTPPTIGVGEESKPNTHIGDFEIQLTKPGDSVAYTFDVKNNGTIDATLGTLTLGTPQCTSIAEPTVENDATIVCDNLKFELTYTDGGTPVAQNDTLNKGETKNLTLKVSFDGDELPTDDVSIDGLDVTMIYNQK